jgi:transcriptional regulator with XRE-family HTH domain
VPNPSKQRQDPTLVALGSTIRRLRLQQGISQENLALMVEIDRSYAGRIERGDNNVTLLTLTRIASALGMSVAELMKSAKL